MQTANLLLCVAVLMVISVVWHDSRQDRRPTAGRKTVLLVAGLFALISAALQAFL